MKQRPVRHPVEYVPYLAVSRTLMGLPHDTVRNIGRALGSLAYLLDRKHCMTVGNRAKPLKTKWGNSAMLATDANHVDSRSPREAENWGSLHR